MGCLRRLDDPEKVLFNLPSECTVGRRPDCQLVLPDGNVSGRHARIAWANAWLLRDLGSTNGTYFNGKRLESMSEVRLTQGDTIAFANPSILWEVVSHVGPLARLVDLQAPESEPLVLVMDDPQGLNLVPSVDDPSATIYQDMDWWFIEYPDGQTRPLSDGDVLELGERRFRVELPRLVTATMQIKKTEAQRVQDAVYEILVAPDEEGAQVNMSVSGEVHNMRNRAHLYLLAYLARQRISEVENGVQREELAGWVATQELCDALGVATQEQLGVYVHRIRKDIAKSGVDNPKDIIDRSRRGWLRIGVPSAGLRVNRV